MLYLLLPSDPTAPPGMRRAHSLQSRFSTAHQITALTRYYNPGLSCLNIAAINPSITAFNCQLQVTVFLISMSENWSENLTPSRFETCLFDRSLCGTVNIRAAQGKLQSTRSRQQSSLSGIKMAFISDIWSTAGQKDDFHPSPAQ